MPEFLGTVLGAGYKDFMSGGQQGPKTSSSMKSRMVGGCLLINPPGFVMILGQISRWGRMLIGQLSWEIERSLVDCLREEALQNRNISESFCCV